MRVRVPDYFLKFKCTADRCTDSCCIGWEIDIDAKTCEKYALLDGDLGDEIRAKTQHGCFHLEKDGRCAFLDGNGLCRIISEVGDGYLCDICREHPRYYGIGKDGLEGGIGLSCPEAARIMLSQVGKPSFCEIEAHPSYDAQDEFAHECDRLRELIYGTVYRSEGGGLLGDMVRIAKYADELAFCLSSGLATPNINDFPKEKGDAKALIALCFGAFDGCEALCDDWSERFERAKNTASEALLVKKIEADLPIFKNLLFYFTHRYVRECIEDISAGARVAFSLLSAILILLLSDGYSEAGCEEASVLFSKNIEYSTDNVEAVMERIGAFL